LHEQAKKRGNNVVTDITLRGEIGPATQHHDSDHEMHILRIFPDCIDNRD
jgi:hypothetical protein